ncbi:dihydrodipicolinate synthase family protein [Sodalis-like endosymbiont of Proechinophthirus fluctus]|uniref:dihydrodipicolinate synthase family protein n=1 Tax=Sodalis-like endosymbiont of Proechinophthirus fluctus TaxID=1462730 RepID=UPI000AF75AE3
MGYDAVSAITPFYYPVGLKNIATIYRAITDAASELTIVVYNIPSLIRVTLTLDQIAILVALPGWGLSFLKNLWRSVSDAADPGGVPGFDYL